MPSRTLQALLAAAAASVAILALLPASASALRTHNTPPQSFEIGTEAECPGGFSGSAAKEVAVDEAHEWIYVVCVRPFPEGSVIKRFDYSGNPVNFTFHAPYLSGNTILGNPNSPELEWTGHSFTKTFFSMAVDNSPTNTGDLFVSGGCKRCGPPGVAERMVEIFKPSGEWVRELDPLDTNQALDLAIDPQGNVYVLNPSGFPSGHGLIRKFDGASLSETERLFPVDASQFFAVDSKGDPWASYGGECICNPPIARWEASSFSKSFSDEEIVAAIINPGTYEEILPSPYVSPSRSFTVQPEAEDIAVDQSNDNLYVDNGEGILSFTPGSPEEFSHRTGPVIGEGSLNGNSEALDVTRDGHVFATEGREVFIWGPGDIVPDIRTPAPAVDELGHTTATLHAHIERSGGGPITGCKLRVGTSQNPESWSLQFPCSPDPSGTAFTAPETEVSATATGLTQGQTYYYRFEASNENGSNYGGIRSFVPPYVLKLHTEPVEVNPSDPHSVTLHGSFDPDGIETHYWFEYGATSGYGQSTEEAGPVTAPGKFDASAVVSQLPSGKTFHYRLVAKTPEGETRGEDVEFRTVSPPDIAGQNATEVAATSATLNARVDPVGYPTTYRFEYGKTPSYGSSIPIPDEDIGEGSGFVQVSQPVTGLEEGITYHFRVVAENKWGRSTTEDTTFGFSPPVCPNAHVRQQTGANYLPDCRAYELVSPPESGAVVFFPSFMLTKAFFASFPGLQEWATNRGYASDPARVTYWGGQGALEGVDVPNSTFDMYLATRTPTGWVQSAPELHGSNVLFSGEKECSDTLSLCLDHDAGDLIQSTYEGESAPFLFNADGKNLGQLPTNVNVVENGRRFAGQLNFFGDQRPSGDFSHFFFSSSLVKFTTDGQDGSGSSPGSAYDNDIAEKTVKLISKLPSGEPIPRDTCCDRFIKFPAVSADGSHILMSTQGIGGPSHLYMSINDGPVIDVSRGYGVTFVDMTRSGDKVFFIANQRITSEDTDNSADLYMWSAATDEVTLLSQGNGNGNTNSCSPTYGASQCSVTPLATEFGSLPNAPQKVSAHGMDDKIASKSGDVYFYSPELLDPNNPGVLNQRNLYVYRNGEVHLVATFDPNTQVNRMQISEDGTHVAMLTASRLTAYNNKGKKEVYTYNADTGTILCASCKPNGLPPIADAEASEGGRFMSEDGRVFFSTKDSLVPQDANGNVSDVYEYVDGRPQLISGGIGSRDTAGVGIFFPSVPVGLEGVSRDGTDAYFTTYDTLVPEDRNGPFIKLYDARVNGGFDVSYQVAPCEAADECHGEDSAPPPAPTIGTRGELGQSGNVTNGKKRRKHHKRHHKRRHKLHPGPQSAHGTSGRTHG